jgi:hypothetical protein
MCERKHWRRNSPTCLGRLKFDDEVLEWVTPYVDKLDGVIEAGFFEKMSNQWRNARSGDESSGVQSASLAQTCAAIRQSSVARFEAPHENWLVKTSLWQAKATPASDFAGPKKEDMKFYGRRAIVRNNCAISEGPCRGWGIGIRSTAMPRRARATKRR